MNRSKSISVTLAKKYNPEKIINWSDWLVSEKLDGHRAYWSGEHLFSRGKNIIPAPRWFLNDFPRIALDGELYIARGKIDLTTSTVNKHNPIDDEWEKVMYYVFDTPEFAEQSYDKRLEVLVSMRNVSDRIRIVDQFQVRSERELIMEMEDIVEQGGEGLILRDIKARYEYDRTHSLMKLKPLYDAEAKIVGYDEGSGKNSGRLGSFVCLMKSGKTFKCSGMDDAMRDNPPGIGSIISYSFQGLTKNGVPRNPSFLRVRKEIA